MKGQTDISTVSHSFDGTSESVQHQIGTAGTQGTSEKPALIGNDSLSLSQSLVSHQHLRAESEEQVGTNRPLHEIES